MSILAEIVFTYNDLHKEKVFFVLRWLMQTIFWKFSYAEHFLDAIVASDDLPFPDLAQWPQAKNHDIRTIRNDLRIGHYVLLATFNKNTNEGTVRGAGRVESIDGEKITMTWTKVKPSWQLLPHPQGGIAQWRKEGIFRFDVQPANHYKLENRLAKLFKHIASL
ncbi:MULTISPECIES: hypothetical protein [Pseudomonas]